MHGEFALPMKDTVNESSDDVGPLQYEWGHE